MHHIIRVACICFTQKSLQECFRFVLPAIPHAVDLLKGHKKQVADTHKVVQAQEGLSKVCHLHYTRVLSIYAKSQDFGRRHL